MIDFKKIVADLKEIPSEKILKDLVERINFVLPKNLLERKGITFFREFPLPKQQTFGKVGPIVLSTTFFKTFPSKIEDFSTYLGDAIPWLYLNSPAFISSENKASMKLLYDVRVMPNLTWLQIRANTTDPTIKNDYWDGQLLDRRHDIEQLLLDIFHDVPDSTWTPEARTKLRRPAKATTHTAAQIMEIAPQMSILMLMHLGIKYHFHCPDTPESDAMPKYQHIVLEYFIGAKGLDPSTIIFGNSTEVKHSQIILNFIEANVGQWIYVRARYVNTKGQPSLFWTAVLPSQIS